MKKIAIIGANEAITMLINKAKLLGYETHVFAWKCGDPGEKAADFFYPISIDHKVEIAEKCREIGIAGVCSITSDYAAPTVAFVARELGLPGNPKVTDEVARNKYKMRCAFKQAGLFTPQFIQVGKKYTEDDIASLAYPVIVKPTDRWSSKGVTRVNNKYELNAAIEYAVSESFDDHAIIEGFMVGPEYSAECICFNGEKKILAFTQKQTTGFPHYIESGHYQPASLTIEEKNRATKVILRALDALEIRNSAAHAEFRILENGEIGIIEIGARMGGDCIGTDLTPISTGMDYIRMVIDVACGNPVSFDIVTEPHPVSVHFIMNHEDIIAYEELKKNKPDLVIRASTFDESFENIVKDSSTRHGYYIVRE